MGKSDDPMIAALLREREGYVAFGKKERVKAVDEELKRRGHEPESDEKPKADEKPKGRASRDSKQATADDSREQAKG